MQVFSLIFIWQMIFVSVFAKAEQLKAAIKNQIQDFETGFTIQSYRDEFLSGGTGMK